jgi:predicted nucleic acid-binding Zn ribbon protein
VRRSAPRPVAVSLERITAGLAPATLIAEVQRAWPEAAGEAFAATCTPASERAGTVWVDCESAVWAQELDLLSERVLERLNRLVGDGRVTRLRARTGRGDR